MQKKIFLLTVLLVMLQICQAQTKSIKNAWAFVKPMAYGKELKGLDGNTITRNDTAFFIYFEVKGKLPPQLNAVTYNGKTYNAAVHLVTEARPVAGMSQFSGKDVVLKRTVLYSLWKAELSTDKSAVGPISKKVLIRGKHNGQSFSLTLNTPVLLAPDIAG